MIHDFHTHSFLSDGVLSPIELIRRAVAAGYSTIAVADHAGPGNLETVLGQLRQECTVASQHWSILALPAVEITHVPVATIASLARRAKQAGAAVVVVHGETVVEPVEPGTNAAAVDCEDVDILAHPGLLTPEVARRAAERGCFIELTARRGHAFTNGLVARVAQEAGAALVVDSDGHAPEDLLTARFARTVVLGAGLPESAIETVLETNPARLLERVRRTWPPFLKTLV